MRRASSSSSDVSDPRSSISLASSLAAFAAFLAFLAAFASSTSPPDDDASTVERIPDPGSWGGSGHSAAAISASNVAIVESYEFPPGWASGPQRDIGFDSGRQASSLGALISKTGTAVPETLPVTRLAHRARARFACVTSPIVIKSDDSRLSFVIARDCEVKNKKHVAT